MPKVFSVSKAASAVGGAVSSVFGRTGDVVAVNNDYTTALVPDSTDKRYVTDAQRTVIGNTSGTNTGDQTVPGFATPAILLDSTAAAGAASTVVRSNSTIAAFDATVPSTQAFGDSAAVGTAAFAARRDHKHAMPATPTSVSGNAGTATTLQTSRNIDGQAFNGSADITVIAPGTHAATGKTTPVDADELPLVDSAASNVLKKLTWANTKATLKTYFDTLYAVAGAAPALHASTHKPGGTDALMTVISASGTSTSGTPATTVAAVTAAANTQFVGWSIFAAQTSAANNQMKIIITYSDTTTTTDSSVATTATTMFANSGGIERTAAGAWISLVAGSAKAVTGLRVETLGTATGSRSAVISAIQVPL